MRTLLIPKDGVPFFGEDIPDEKLGQRLTRLAEPLKPVSAHISIPYYEPILLEHYDFKGTVVRREGQPILALYEQV